MIRRYQFRLTAMFALTAITAAFFASAAMVGYVDATITLVALSFLGYLIRCPRRVHLLTGIALALLAGILLWANLRPTRWEREFCEVAPRELNHATNQMFWRGWPVCPWMLCTYHQMAFDPIGGCPEAALVFDGVLFASILLAAKFACEHCLRRLKSSIHHPDRSSGAYGSTDREPQRP